MIKNIYMIVAITKNSHAIGKNRDMIYHLRDDLKYFKKITLHHTIVCGRTTYFSFPKRPLPDRKNIILTRSDNNYEGAYTLHSKKEVVEYAKNHPKEKIFIVGGDSIYHQFLDISSKLYITEIDESLGDKAHDADSFFPKFDKEKWEVESISEYVYPDNAPRYRYVVYKRKWRLNDYVAK